MDGCVAARALRCWRTEATAYNHAEASAARTTMAARQYAPLACAPVDHGRIARGAALSLTAAAGAFLADALPAVTVFPRLRRSVAPRLSGVGRHGHVALTFDDGPDPVSTPSVLAELDRLGLRATFFVLGAQVRRWPSLAAEVAAAGHELALHGDRHRSHLLQSPRAVAEDVARALDAVAGATGAEPRFLRPPYGVLTGATLLAARRHRLAPVLWTAWGHDWEPTATPTTVLSELSRDLEAGATVLLHDSDCTSAPASWRAGLGALEGLRERCLAAGLALGPLCDHGL
jgi:peptidoglycan/xylan/chitin deacetylase (PgdA/CDA1 family)